MNHIHHTDYFPGSNNYIKVKYTSYLDPYQTTSSSQYLQSNNDLMDYLNGVDQARIKDFYTLATSLEEVEKDSIDMKRKLRDLHGDVQKYKQDISKSKDTVKKLEELLQKSVLETEVLKEKLKLQEEEQKNLQEIKTLKKTWDLVDQFEKQEIQEGESEKSQTEEFHQLEKTKKEIERLESLKQESPGQESSDESEWDHLQNSELDLVDWDTVLESVID